MRSAIKNQNKHQNEVIFVTSDSHFSKHFLQKRRQSESSGLRSAHDISPYNQPFTFTGKEWCKSLWLAQRGPERGISETGYGYFGARYYDSDLSGLFLSVDPLADKYPSISPYAYCTWNPVKLVDPDGMEIDDYYNLKGKLVYRTESGDNKYILITNESKIDNPDKYYSIAVPTMETMRKMESMYKYVEKNEQGIVLGIDGNSSSIVNGNWDEITPQQWGPALKEISDVDCLIHLHTSNFEKCEIGSIHPSDKDMNGDNFFNKLKTGIILTKRRKGFDNSIYRTACKSDDYDNYISFYTKGRSESLDGMLFIKFQQLVEKILSQ